MLIVPTKTRITQKGQVTIPKEIRDYLGLKARNRIEFKINRGQVFIHPADSLDKNFGIIKPKNSPENFSFIRKKMQKKLAKEVVREFTK